MKMSLEDILGDSDDYSGDFASPDVYQTYVDDLASALGLSKEKAAKAASAICGLVRYEQDQAKSGQKVTVTVGG